MKRTSASLLVLLATMLVMQPSAYAHKHNHYSSHSQNKQQKAATKQLKQQQKAQKKQMKEQNKAAKKYNKQHHPLSTTG